MSEEQVIEKNSEDAEGSTKLCPNSGFLKLPYDVICRQRLAWKKRKFAAQINRELNHMIAMKMRAVDGIRLDLLFSNEN